MSCKNLVTVCIPTYNRAKLLKKSLNSVVKQDFNNIKILVIDNNSTDNTIEVVKNFCDKRITYIKNKINIGFSGNLQRCFDLVETPYMIFLADDDFFLQGAIRKLILSMTKNHNCIIGKSANFRFFNDDLIPDIIDQKSKNITILKRGDEAISKSISYGLGSFSGLIIKRGRRKIKVLSNGLLSSLIEPLLSLLKEKDFIYIPEILVGLRCHDNLAYAIYNTSSYSRELFPIYDKLIKNKKILNKTKVDFLKFSVDDFFNIRIYGNRIGVIKEIKFILINNPAVLLKFKSMIFFILSLILPKKLILTIKKMIILINSKKINHLLYVNNIKQNIIKYV